MVLAVALGGLAGAGVRPAVAQARPAAADAPSAAGGVRLIEAAETAPATVVAVVVERHGLDARSYAARLEVEVSLRGPVAPGDEVQVAWEELAPSRVPRFAEGDVVLVSLEKLSGDSIWRQRLPDPALRSRALAVAMDGGAFLHRPSGKMLLELQHYLALAPEDRRGPAGVARLAALAQGADPAVAEDAVRRLDACPDLDASLDSFSGTQLAGALVREDATPALRDAVVELIGRRRLASTRPGLEALAALPSPGAASALEALARLDGELPADSTRRLLADASPARRAVAARHASGPEAAHLLEERIRGDAAPEVRQAAVERLAELRGDAALDVLVGALGDPEPPVRAASMRALATFGASAVPALRRVLDGNDPVAARAALAALSLSPAPSARAALVEVADEHPDAELQRLAGVALGRKIPEH